MPAESLVIDVGVGTGKTMMSSEHPVASSTPNSTKPVSRSIDYGVVDETVCLDTVSRSSVDSIITNSTDFAVDRNEDEQRKGPTSSDNSLFKNSWRQQSWKKDKYNRSRSRQAQEQGYKVRFIQTGACYIHETWAGESRVC